MDKHNFPDFPHFLQLQDALWKWPKSRAALMVGAGFSKNAEPIPGATKKFPSWNELVQAMFDKLEPVNEFMTKSDLDARIKRFEMQKEAPTRLASKFEAIFGRSNLDALIRAQNPDSEYEPGRLHEMLVQLPWTDIFTTNYDTLLERTEVLGRSYTTVSTASELAHASQPRIVKLHGSFSSNTELIISEDNFRRYPQDNAPFLNTVRQSLLENVFVMVGFSGEDSNFLSWAGWIRDELGGQHAKIYLVGTQSLDLAGRALLRHRGITPIDLAPVFQNSTSIDVHYDSLRWFLESLAAGRPRRSDKWPYANVKKIENKVAGISVLQPVNLEPERILAFDSTKVPLTMGRFAAILSRWTSERTSCPNWLVAPFSKRQAIWFATERWIYPLIEFSKGFHPMERIVLLAEIAWRLDFCLMPLDPEIYDAFDSILSDSFKFVSSEPCDDVTFQERSKYRQVNYINSWLDTGFSLIRRSRERYEFDKWESLRQKLEAVVKEFEKQVDKYQYERALFSLWNGSPDASKILEAWHPSANNLRALLWKASVLIEMNQSQTARDLLEHTLRAIRLAQLRQGQTVELLSMEGFCSYSLVKLAWALDHNVQYGEAFEDRWKELSAWDCNPWKILEDFENRLTGQPPKPAFTTEVKYLFDPGTTALNLHYSSEGTDSYISACTYIRSFEQAGIPMHYGQSDSNDTLETACEWIAPSIPFWSGSLLVRALQFEQINKKLSRPYVGTMDHDIVLALCDWISEILFRKLKNSTTLDSHDRTLVAGLVEVFSRLTIQLDLDILNATFLKVMELYSISESKTAFLNAELYRWCGRLFETADEVTLLLWLPKMLAIPADTVCKFGHDPLSQFPTERISRFILEFPDSETKFIETAEYVLNRAEIESGPVRDCCISRLFVLLESSLLSAEHEDKLGCLIWDREKTDNLPSVAGVNFWTYLQLPAPPYTDVSKHVKAKILSMSYLDGCSISSKTNGFESVVGGKEVSTFISAAGKASDTSNRRRLGKTIQWTPSESKKLFEQARRWWHTVRGAFVDKERHLNKSTVGLELALFVKNVILPHALENENWLQIIEWHDDLRAHGIYLTSCIPTAVVLKLESVQKAKSQIIDDVASNSSLAVQQSANAILEWFEINDDGLAATVDFEFLNAIIRKISFRTAAGISDVLRLFTYLVAKYPSKLRMSQALLVADSLTAWNKVTSLTEETSQQNEFPLGLRPFLRSQLGFLAGALWFWFSSRHPYESMPNSLTLWKHQCDKELLPEIRRSFDEGLELATVIVKALALGNHDFP